MINRQDPRDSFNSHHGIASHLDGYSDLLVMPVDMQHHWSVRLHNEQLITQ